MISAICETCSKEFKTHACNIAAGKGRFCSRACVNAAGVTKIHGHSKSRLYVIWCSMKSRCLCPTAGGYPYYGARGITVCKEWVESFEAFRVWAMANGYQEELELDRKEAGGNYEPNNCRWATRTQQMRNTGKRRDAETSKFKGVSLHSQNKRWIAQIGHNRRTIYIGSFDSEIEAAEAYDQEARRLFGDYANTNFQDGGVPR